MKNYQQRGTRYTVGIVDFTTHMRQSLDFGFTELLSRIQTIEYDAGDIGRVGIRPAIRRQRSGSRLVPEKDGALGRAYQVSPIRVLPPWVKQPDF